MKTLKVLSLIFLIGLLCMLACQKEEFIPELETQSAYFQKQEAPTILTSPSSTRWVKKKADRKIEEVIKIIDNFYIIPDGELLDLAAYCLNRSMLVELTGLDYNLVKVATEYQDLKRLGLNNEEAAILLGAMFFGIKNNDGSPHASLDVEEVQKQDVDKLRNWIIDFVKEHCVDCLVSDIPEKAKVASWIEKAKLTPLLISYSDEEGRCHYGNGSYQVEVSPASTKWVKKKADHFTSLFQDISITPSIMTSPLSTKWVKKKAEQKIKEIIAVIAKYYNIPDGGLLEMAAYCKNRLEIAEYSGMDYELLTLGVEYQDLQRLGLNNEEAAILLGALFFQLQDADGNRHPSIDIEEVSKQSQILLVNDIKSFVDQHCDDCIQNDIPSIQKVKSWIQAAKELRLLVSYPNEANKCIYGNGVEAINISPASTKWVKKKAD